MPTKEELQKQIDALNEKAAEGQKLIDQGRQLQHDITAQQNDLREQIRQIEREENKA